jgi:nitrous oxidase accessory protein
MTQVAAQMALLFLLPAAVTFTPRSTLAAVWEPSPLQARIDAAAPGDTIRVAPGTYRGQLLLNKPIVLLGEGYPVLRGPGFGSVVTVEADSCTIMGFVIEGSGSRLMDEDSGIKVLSCANRIVGNRLRDNTFGIYLMESHDNLIAENDIVGRGDIIEADRGNGIHLWNARRNRLEGNIIRDARDGIYFSFADENEVVGNRISDLRYGLHYMYSDSNAFHDNLFSRNVAGAALMYSKHITFRANAFIHNRGHRAFGILLQSVESVQADSNWVVDNRVALMLDNAIGCVFTRNLISNNDTAVQLFSTASGNVFWRNNFIDNLAEIKLAGRPKGNAWSRDGSGNYWSRYRGFDWNGDGIGDQPYHIRDVFDYLTVALPEFTLYLFSPAAQAIEATERLMPLMDVPEQVDPSPLLQPVPVPPPPLMAMAERLEIRGSFVAAGISVLLSVVPLLLLWKGQRR